MKPATLAWVWSVGGNGPPCQHIRGKPWFSGGHQAVKATKPQDEKRAEDAHADKLGDGDQLVHRATPLPSSSSYLGELFRAQRYRLRVSNASLGINFRPACIGKRPKSEPADDRDNA